MSITIDTNAGEVIGQLGNIEKRAFVAVERAVVAGGELVTRTWKANARTTAGEHGRWYPDAIEGHKTGALEFTVKPNPAKRQGSMSFERGSRNQPPHMDAHRAFLAQRWVVQQGIRKALGRAL